MSLRPTSLAELAKRVKGGEDFSVLFREFLDAFYATPAEDQRGALSAEPPRIDVLHDAWLGATAEELSKRNALPVPTWTEDPCRFMTRAYFAGGLESLKPILLVESPSAFRRRQLFVSANALSRV